MKTSYRRGIIRSIFGINRVFSEKGEAGAFVDPIGGS
jgi:hypothetical protein